jgi:putative sigma-54 modulation protein
MNRKNKSPVIVEEKYNVTVKGPHIVVTAPLQDYAIEKINKIERFSPRLIEVAVNMDVQKLEHKVDIIMRYDSILIKSQGNSTDMYASIDIAVDKLQSQIRRYKDKIQDHHARALKSIDMHVNVFLPHQNDEVAEVNEGIEAANTEWLHFNQPVTAEKRPLKLLRLDEAMMHLELSKDTFLIYRAEEDLKLKVIYLRKDGNYGVIEPEA